MKPTYAELLSALERLTSLADLHIPNNVVVPELEEALNDAAALVHHAKEARQ